jgi:flagellar motility protein MotE (MotC chaperone)
MTIKLTRRERHTVLAALQRWLSYPAAREADSIATNGGKHKPLDNAEIERLCKRITQIGRKRGVGSLLRQSDDDAREQKRPKLRGDIRTAQDGMRAQHHRRPDAPLT